MKKFNPLNKKVLIFVFFSALLQVFTFSDAAHAVTRAEMAAQIMKSLNIPVSAESSHFSDVTANHKYYGYIETARALGIIYPGDRFYPDIEATLAESVFFALKAMGLRHEASLADNFIEKEWKDIPTYIQSYLSLAEGIEPSFPPGLIESPASDLTPESLNSLTEWIRKCMTGMEWKLTLGSESLGLIINRKNIGRAPGKWSVKLAEFDEEKDAEKELTKILSGGQGAYIQRDTCSYSLYIGPYSHYASAWKKNREYLANYECSIVQAGTMESNALFIAALRIDPAQTAPRIVTAPSISGYRLPLSWISRISKADAVVNGGYFYGKNPVGSLVINSVPQSFPLAGRTALGWNGNGDFNFGSGTFRCTFQTGEEKFDITTFNSPPGRDGIGLYSPEFIKYATDLQKDSMEMVVKHGEIIKIRPWAQSNHSVPEEGFLVAARGYSKRKMENLLEGDKVSISLTWADGAMDSSTSLVQGGPVILNNGNISNLNEGLSDNITRNRHPRTITAHDGKFLWFIVIDGRNSWHSRGATIREAAMLLKDMGMTDALNLDGGGSSQLIWKDFIINSLSGGVERRMPYSIILKDVAH